jgi:hypothetical protein
MMPSFLYVFIFRVTRAGDDHWLLEALLLIEATDIVGCLKTVENRHIEVHEDQTVVGITSREGAGYHLHSLLPTWGMVDVF